MTARYVLSRFACVRREAEALIIESAASGDRMALADPRAAALVGALAEPGTLADVARRTAADPDDLWTLLGPLVRAGLVEHADAADDRLRTWSFHDLLFRTGSRRDRPPDGESGAVEASEPSAWAELERSAAEPDVDGLPFADVLESRRSLRSFGEPITIGQLGRFLDRVRSAERLAARLGIYPVVGACRGLEIGTYRYDSDAHRLGLLSGRTPELERMLCDAQHSAQLVGERAQVLLVLTARHAGRPYAAGLEDVGACLLRMYLVATAMGLAACALGCGDSDAFGRAAGARYCAEPSLGELLLGSRPERRCECRSRRSTSLA